MTTRRGAKLLVRAATRTLPRGGLRDRWAAELLAELDASEPSRQTAFARGVLLHAWSLRRAVLGSAAGPSGQLARPRAPFHCRWHLYHHYRPATTEDGHRYLRCAECGRDEPSVGGQPLDGMAWAASTIRGTQ